MAAEFRKIVLHAVVGFPQDFRPRAIFMPEILLGMDPVRRASLNQILPHPNEWGGWTARVFEALLQFDSARAHLFVTVPLKEIKAGTSPSGWGFIQPLKRDLVATRTRLLDLGPREISTCALIVREELTALGEDMDLGREMDRLDTLGFRHRFAFSERTEGSPHTPFERIVPPALDEDGIEKWADRLIGSCASGESA